MNKLIIEDWVLYDMELVGFVGTDAYTGQDYADCEEQAKCIRVVGTKKQIDKLSKSNRYNVDEVYTYEKEKKGSYWDGIVFSETRKDRPTLKEYNQKYTETYKRYEKMYMANDNQLLILRTS
jgi:hypothetical protein